MISYFPSVIGQEETKRTLSFYIDGFRSKGLTNNLIFSAPRGYGKTMIVREFARNLVSPITHKAKPLLEINAASIKNVASFFNDIIIPHCIDTNLSLFFDEIHCLKPEVVNVMLSILAPNKNNINYYTYDNNQYEFNFYKLTFLAATTRIQRIPIEFTERCSRVELKPYKPKHMAEILKKNLSTVTIKNSLYKDIVPILRGNPRRAIEMANNIESYASQHEKYYFDEGDWNDIKYTFDIKPLGLTQIELQALSIMSKYNGITLGHLAGRLGLSPSTVRNDTETYLINNDLMFVDSKRFLSKKGRDILKQAEDAEST